jgi:arylsulfatase A-like enzyme
MKKNILPVNSMAVATSLVALSQAALSQAACAAGVARSPNIVYILADDMGLGDVSAFNPASAWKTPHIDRLAREGMRFTDAHSSSAVCTPSRYSILTGRYCWRTVRKSGAGTGLAPALIEPGRMTVASLLKEQGYTTAIIGKWHLGLDWVRGEKNAGVRKNKSNGEELIDYTKPFGGGPLAHGFDYFVGIGASLDMAPYFWLRNDRVDPATLPPHYIKGDESQKLLRRAGLAGKDFEHAGVLPRLAGEAVSFIEKQDARKPFFLYVPLTAPHTPILPAKEFAGSTRTTEYGDFCAAVDAVVGQIDAALAAGGFDKNTIVIFAADNGCSPAVNFDELRAFKHDPNLGRRGYKADIYEGGHRVPLVIRWPGRVAKNSVSDELVSLGDFFATCAGITGTKFPDEAGEDSVSMLPVLTSENGKPPAPLHEALVHHSNYGAFAIRKGPWKLVLCADSGGWSEPRHGEAPVGSPPFQLFNLDDDPGEKTNLCAEHPEIVGSLGRLLKKYVLEGRGTPGAPQKNAGGNNWPELAWMKQFK